MKKNLLLLMMTVLFITSQSTALKATALECRQEKVETLKVKGVDPVCKMKVKAGTTLTHTHNKVLYGFCAEACKKKFVSDPSKYIKN